MKTVVVVAIADIRLTPTFVLVCSRSRSPLYFLQEQHQYQAHAGEEIKTLEHTLSSYKKKCDMNEMELTTQKNMNEGTHSLLSSFVPLFLCSFVVGTNLILPLFVFVQNLPFNCRKREAWWKH